MSSSSSSTSNKSTTTAESTSSTSKILVENDNRIISSSDSDVVLSSGGNNKLSNIKKGTSGGSNNHIIVNGASSGDFSDSIEKPVISITAKKSDNNNKRTILMKQEEIDLTVAQNSNLPQEKLKTITQQDQTLSPTKMLVANSKNMASSATTHSPIAICINSVDEPESKLNDELDGELESSKQFCDETAPIDDAIAVFSTETSKESNSFEENRDNILSAETLTIRMNSLDIQGKDQAEDGEISTQSEKQTNRPSSLPAVNSDEQKDSKKRSKPLIRSGAVRESSLSPPPDKVGGYNQMSSITDNNHLTVAYNNNSSNSNLVTTTANLSGSNGSINYVNNSIASTAGGAGTTGNSFSNSKNSSIISSNASSPSLSRDSSSEMQEMSLSETKAFLTDALKKSLSLKQFLYNIETEIIQFMQDSNKDSFKIHHPASYKRKLIHKTAEYFQLEHLADPSVVHTILLTKTQNSRIPEENFKEMISKEQDSNNVPKKSILKRDSTSLDDSPGSSFDKDKSPVSSLLNGGSLSDSSHSRSLEEREENYEKVRARIFNETDSATKSTTLEGIRQENNLIDGQQKTEENDAQITSTTTISSLQQTDTNDNNDKANKCDNSNNVETINCSGDNDDQDLSSNDNNQQSQSIDVFDENSSTNPISVSISAATTTSNSSSGNNNYQNKNYNNKYNNNRNHNYQHYRGGGKIGNNSSGFNRNKSNQSYYHQNNNPNGGQFGHHYQQNQYFQQHPSSSSSFLPYHHQATAVPYSQHHHQSTSSSTNIYRPQLNSHQNSYQPNYRFGGGGGSNRNYNQTRFSSTFRPNQDHHQQQLSNNHHGNYGNMNYGAIGYHQSGHHKSNHSQSSSTSHHQTNPYHSRQASHHHHSNHHHGPSPTAAAHPVFAGNRSMNHPGPHPPSGPLQPALPPPPPQHLLDTQNPQNNPYLLRFPGVLNPAFNQYNPIDSSQLAAAAIPAPLIQSDQLYHPIAYMNPSTMVPAPPLLASVAATGVPGPAPPPQPHHHPNSNVPSNIPNSTPSTTTTAVTNPGQYPPNLSMANSYPGPPPTLLYGNIAAQTVPVSGPNAVHHGNSTPYVNRAATAPLPHYHMMNPAAAYTIPINLIATTSKNESQMGNQSDLHENNNKQTTRRQHSGPDGSSTNNNSSNYDRIAQVQYGSNCFKSTTSSNGGGGGNHQQTTATQSVCFQMPQSSKNGNNYVLSINKPPLNQQFNKQQNARRGTQQNDNGKSSSSSNQSGNKILKN